MTSENDLTRASGIADEPAVEVICDNFPRGGYRAALFDFDGTLSLLRRDWQQVMVSMMVGILRDCETDETDPQLREIVNDYVARLTGRQTIYQMIQLAEEVRKRGGRAREPLQYKRQYHDLLSQLVEPRIESVRSGELEIDEMTVPDSRHMLEALQNRGVALYLSSGTDLPFVRDELTVLRLDEFFEPRVYGALDEYQKFSKALTIDHILSSLQIDGSQLIGFGDGYVEAEEVMKVGGLAIGVASNESTRHGVDPWKRDRLIRAGAKVIVGDYRQYDQLLDLVGLD